MIQRYQSKMQRLCGQYAHFCQRVKEEKAALRNAEAETDNTLEAQKIVQEVAQAVQQKVHQQIASVVSKCLKTVFGDSAYDFRIDFVQSRGKTEAHLLFVRDGKEVDPLTASGGGVVDVTSFSLRLACLVLARPRRRLFLGLDESFKHLSEEYRPRIRELLEKLSEDFGIQFLLITHFRDLEVGKVVTLE